MYVLELAGQDDRFAAAEARNAASGVDVAAPGLATARSIVPARLRGLAYTRRASTLLGRAGADVGAARALLESSDAGRAGTVAVRARDVRSTAGVDTQRAERELGAVLTGRGLAVDLDDPDHELVALFSGSTCALGWAVVEGARGFGDRAPTDRPFFQPGSMDPRDARALVNLAGARAGRTLLDPMCGTGGILIEAGLVGARALGIDAQPRMVRGSRRNLRAFLDGGFDVARGDAARLPVREDAADAAVFDTPYGRQSRIEGDGPDDLLAGALSEARRVAPRAVVVGDRSREGMAREAGWAVEDRFERRVHRSLVRHVHVLCRS